jgi:cytochrome c oxidase subunit 2
MQIHAYERVFLGLTMLVLVVGLVAIGGSVLVGHVNLPSPVARVDPRTLRETPPFDQPGLRETAPGQYEAVMVAQIWRFEPNEITVPVGSTVTFRVASLDVTHGFLVEGENVNLTLIPGQVSMATATFRTPGEHLILCHEYCGAGHHVMYGKVNVQ